MPATEAASAPFGGHERVLACWAEAWRSI